MIKKIRISKPEEILHVLSHTESFEIPKRERATFYLYKGISNSEDEIKTSLADICGPDKKRLEKSILRNFTKYASEVGNPHLFETVWQQMIIGSRHGLPTRLIDWSRSPLVALHFALSDVELSELDLHDSVIWAIDINETNQLLRSDYKEKLQNLNAYVFPMDAIIELAPTLEKYDNDMAGNSFVMIEPPAIDERIMNQYSFFSAIPTAIDSVSQFLEKNTENTIKYIISAKTKWQIRDMLDSMNINERILFPGYDGLCEWLKRYYYN